MDYVKRFFVFLYNFLIGEDWIGSLIIVAGFVLTYFVAQAGIIAYWVVLASVLVSLIWSLWWRSNKKKKRRKVVIKAGAKPSLH